MLFKLPSSWLSGLVVWRLGGWIPIYTFYKNQKLKSARALRGQPRRPSPLSPFSRAATLVAQGKAYKDGSVSGLPKTEARPSEPAIRLAVCAPQVVGLPPLGLGNTVFVKLQGAASWSAIGLVLAFVTPRCKLCPVPKSLQIPFSINLGLLFHESRQVRCETPRFLTGCKPLSARSVRLSKMPGLLRCSKLRQKSWMTSQTEGSLARHFRLLEAIHEAQRVMQTTRTFQLGATGGQ